jgi:molybdate transport system substrate-binding protein
LAFAFAEASDFDLSTATREPNVKAVLARVARGEVDFGFVYQSDAQSAQGQVIEIKGTGAKAFITSYSLAVARQGQNRQDVRAFAEAATQTKAQAVLRELGFLDP